MLTPHPLALIVIGAISAFLATKRGKNPILWFFLGALFGIFGLIFLFFSKPTPATQRRKTAHKNDPQTIDITPKVDDRAKEKFWYYLDPKNIQKGPMSFDGLIRSLREGRISAKTFVWNETLENWQPLGDFMYTETT